MYSSFNQPVIIIGMHRSGTTLITQLIQYLGFFAGAYLTENQEASFFVSRNDMLMRRAGGAWDQPKPVRDMFNDSRLLDSAVIRMGNSVHSYEFVEFIGIKSLFSVMRSSPIGPWGWKDPRNTFTLPVWQRLFPGAKLLLVRRNGVDVAHSLIRRAEKRKTTDPSVGLLAPVSLHRRIVNLIRPVPSFDEGFSARCLNLEQGFALWNEYTEEAETRYESWRNERMAIRYEDFLVDSKKMLAQIGTFCGLAVTDQLISKAVEEINPYRAYSFLKDNETHMFYERVRHTSMMKKLGYDSIES